MIYKSVKNTKKKLKQSKHWKFSIRTEMFFPLEIGIDQLDVKIPNQSNWVIKFK